MHWLRSALVALALVSVAQACAVGDPQPDNAGGKETTGQLSEALTTACSFDTIGLPCDPDGPAGAKLECEGVCVVSQTGYAACAGVSAPGQMNGVVCGTTNGVGDNACKRVCSGKSCLAANAPAGAGCRLTAGGNPCEGQCTGFGVCGPVLTPCNYGREGQLCHFATCNLAAVSQCSVKNLLKNTLCSDTDQ